jgi:probable O-glycosylation ligase (exosortase A-associated)
MKQLILMIALTMAGTLGTLINGPLWGLTLYYLFAVLRPQYLWKWALPPDVQWSLFVALATLIATALFVFGFYGGAQPTKSRRLSTGHGMLLGFGLWLVLSYLLAYDQVRAEPIMIDYSKILIMMTVSAFVVREVSHIRLLTFVALLSLCYIGYEVNFMYLVQGYLGIYHNGYGGLDNNGAGLMLAMAIPLCIFIWESDQRWWRWFFAAMVPVLLHAVLMTYSRGAMVALIVVAPLLYLRSRRKRMMTVAFIMLAMLVPILAGAEIRERFFSVERYQQDNSAQSRLASWRAGFSIAKDHPIFGIGPRNSQAVIFAYGADMQGRVIHSQYVQIAADNGFIGLGWYLCLLGSAWMGLRRVRLATKGEETAEARRVRALAAGLECSLAVFCTGAIFLSLEVFELPYLFIMLAIQFPLALQLDGTTEVSSPTLVAHPAITGRLNPVASRSG